MKPYLICYSEQGNLLDIGDEWMYILSGGEVQYIDKLKYPATPLAFIIKAGWTPAISEEELQELDKWYEGVLNANRKNV